MPPYRTVMTKELQAELKLANIHQVPKLEKIVVSVGIGKNKDDKHYYEVVRNTLTKITGQHPVDRAGTPCHHSKFVSADRRRGDAPRGNRTLCAALA